MRTIVALLFVIAAAYAANLLHGDSATAISGSYIVMMHKTLDAAARDAHVSTLKDAITSAGDSSVIRDIYTIGDSFIGFSADLSPEMLKAQLAHPDVEYIEVDQVVKAHTTDTQIGATWGLDRIDQRALPLSSNFIYNNTQGFGAHVYVIDTGIYIGNKDFEGRAKHSYNYFSNEGNDDQNGHGTHCAGTIGGATYGVAKEVSLYGVKVLNAQGSGTNAGVIAGVQHVAAKKKEHVGKAVIASMSLGGGVSTALDEAIKASIKEGVVNVVAAGNDNQNACNYSPARVATAITVGATDSQDRRATYSNFGSCVDIFAPGTSINSDWIGSTTATKIISGTSMATPHVAGVLALHLAKHPTLTPAQAASWLNSVATSGVITSPGTGSPNRLLYAPYH